MEERVNSERFISTSGATDLLNWLSSMSKRIRTIRKEHNPVPARPKRYLAVSAAGESKASVILVSYWCVDCASMQCSNVY